ncbi:MAG: amino acid permease [Bacteroidales bacterium]
MAKSKKFGTFSGVFLPSFLAIIGVIMYLRLGWIVGQTGLYNTILIILFACTISLFTGLSIASIATDKKIKAGGVYYILSRSLGLPMGGAIGISITLAMTFVISLNLIGFAETFLSIEAVSNFLHLPPNLNSYRIVATVFLIILFITNFISTSLAVKSQYIVFGAIILSFISIILGVIFPSNPPAMPNLYPAENHIGFMALFAIFFPAVTGFTSGVAMSGELKNPKKSIPLGVMSAILISIVIYILMATIFAYSIDRNILLHTDAPIVELGYFSSLVILGICGATLSTALGSVLGAPKTLAAIANDGVLPKFLAKTYGKSNEPRISMLLIAIIAEAGILIGDLNLIAPIVTMFFMVSYAFINLAFFLEKWSSTDFRPSFKISKYIGLLGFLLCLYFMFEINPLSMLLSILVMLLIYAIIKRKNLRLELGDVWQSVFLSITRGVISKMTKRTLESRNWQPNILIFGGTEEERPYLKDFGKWLAGQHGFITNFELCETSEDNLFTSIDSKHEIPLSKPTNEKIYTKECKCLNIYDAIETLSKTYGFTGIEPNTILLGYNNQSENKEHFAKMLSNISKLDKNILLMHYNKDSGFGNKKIIDIWITKEEPDSIFAINLIKMLWLDDNWAQSILRINVVSTNNNSYSFIYNKLDNLLQQMRIPGEIRIVNNELENKPLHELVKTHCFDSDLVFIGLPNFEENQDKAYNKIFDLSTINKTIIFIISSKQFKAIDNLDIVTKQITEKDNNTLNIDRIYQDWEIPLRPEAVTLLSSIKDKLNESREDCIMFKVKVLLSYLTNTLEKINSSFDINNKITSLEAFKNYMNSSTTKATNVLNVFIDEKIQEFENIFINFGNEYFKEITEIQNNLPDPFVVLYSDELSFEMENDTAKQKILRNKIKKFYAKNKDKKLYPYHGNIKKYISFELSVMYNEILELVYKQIKQLFTNYYYDINTIIYSVNDFNLKVNTNFNKNEAPNIEKNKITINNTIKNVISNIEDFISDLDKQISDLEINCLNRLTAYLNVFNFNDIKIDRKRLNKSNKDILVTVSESFADLYALLPSLFNRNIVNLSITNFKVNLISFNKDIIDITDHFVNNHIVSKHKAFESDIKKQKSISQISLDTYTFIDTNELYSNLNDVHDKIMKQIQKLPDKITVIDNNSLSKYLSTVVESPNYINFSVSRLIDYLIQNNYEKEIRAIYNRMVQYCSESLEKQKTIFTQISVVEQYENLISDISTKINDEIITLSKKVIDTTKDINIAFELTYEKIQLETFIANAASTKNFAISTKISKDQSKLGKKKSEIIKNIKENFTKFWYKKSESKLITQQMLKRDNDDEKLRRYMASLNKITMPVSVSRTLPYSYLQLFLSVQHYNKDLWVGKQKSINDFKILYEQYLRIKNGCIVINGDIGSGKSFFSYHVIKTVLPNSRIYTVKSVNGGSTSLNKFEVSFLRALESTNIDLNNAIIEAPKRSVFIIENIEQWWHRNIGGDKVINKLIELINRFSKDYLFLLNVNTLGAKSIKMTTDLGSVILGSVSLSPFNAEEIGRIILRRHNAGSFKFILDNVHENNLHSWNYAKLFSTYYNISNGNIKSALSLWISCIDRVDTDTIEIHTPKLPESIPWSLLTRQQIILLAQFAIHNSMSYERIFAITNKSISGTNSDLNTLLKYGLLEKQAENIFGINTVLYPFILKELQKLDII